MSNTPYYETELGKLYHGDCLEIMPMLEPVDLVLTDPPYNIPTQAAQTRKITRTIGDLSMIEASFRLLFDLTLNLVGNDGRHFVFADAISYPVIFRAIYGKAKTALLVWDKGRIGMGREFRKQFELIMHTWGDDTPVVSSEGVGFSDILKRKPVTNKDKLHPAQKPINLIKDLLRVSGKIVLDPFLGSGTTAVACERLNRRWIGIEIEEKYCEIAAKRIEKERSQLKLF